MKRNETTGTGRRLGATTLALVAAGLTAAAFAAFSIAQSGDSNGGGKDQVRPAPFAAPAPPGGPGALAPSAEDREALEAFRQCMDDHGAEPPKPPSGGGPPEPPTKQEREEIEKALEACEDELPEGAHALSMPPPCLDGHEQGERGRA